MDNCYYRLVNELSIQLKFRFIICVILFLLIGCARNSKNDKHSLERESSFLDLSFMNIHSEEFETIDGWGYKILIDKKTYIYQPNIPCISDRRSFKTKTDAKRTAELVIYKVNHGINPPTLNIKELDSLGVLK